LFYLSGSDNDEWYEGIYLTLGYLL
jgi:hypothetical protein